MKRVGFWEAVLGKFCIIFKKDGAYHNIDMLSCKQIPINQKSTKFNVIYNKLSLQKQSSVNDFDVFKAAREQYHIEMGYCFEYDKIWEMVRNDPKWFKMPTSLEVRSKRPRRSGLFDVFDV